MKKIYTLFLLIMLYGFPHSFAQPPGEWTWISGDNFSGGPGTFGTQGVPNVLNTPPALYEGCEWTDLSGNFWFYGGLDNGITMCDLWRYNPVTNEWTWMNGPGGTSTLPVYGTRGVAAPANQPGGRGYGMLSWVDANGTLWMYGGYSNLVNSFMADFWKYDTGTNEWTWMGGDTLYNSSGRHGIMGVSSPNNTPPSSTETACAWTQGDNLWFYSGMTQSAPYIGDMWRYNISSDEWTWMAGDTTFNAMPVYGTLGVSAPSNFPGARMCYSRWKDLNDNFWIFGGTTSGGIRNDLWKFSPFTNEWTWMSGPGSVNDPGDFGATCTASSTSRPPARTEARATWTDDCGVFWLFGGSTVNGWENDLWRYDSNIDRWTWVSGSSTGAAPGVYGIKGVSDPANVPGARQGPHAYLDAAGNLWMLGGYDNAGGMINDLWRYVPDPACGACAASVPVALFSAPNHICPGTCTNFINNSIGATSFLWSFAGASPSTSVDQFPANICYNTPGTYSVSLIATNANGSDTLTLNNYVTVYPYPAPQGITQTGDTLFANQGAVSYQWYYNGNLINGATDYFYLAQASGSYNVVCADLNGCEVEAVIFDVVAGISPTLFEGKDAVADPNPFAGEIKISSAGKMIVFNDLGQKVFEKEITHAAQAVDLSFLQKGVYLLRLENRGRTFQQKLVKM